MIVDGVEYEAGLPVHLKMGLTVDGQGPADPPDPNFHHWGCWCGDKNCKKWLNCQSTYTIDFHTKEKLECVRDDVHEQHIGEYGDLKWYWNDREADK